MPVPWLSLLSKAARIFYPIALSGVSKGLAANTILKAYSTAGPGIRRSLGLEVVRRVRKTERSARAFASLRLDLHPDIARIPLADHKTWRKFSYHVEYRGVSSEGKPFKAHITVVSNTIITRREAEAMAATFLEKAPDMYGIESVEKIQLLGIKKNPMFFSQ